jgi:hypothetical protein
MQLMPMVFGYYCSFFYKLLNNCFTAQKENIKIITYDNN